MVDYSGLYNTYWKQPDKRAGDCLLPDSSGIGAQLLATCGTGRILDIGCGMGGLVQYLLKQGADAYGVDVSSIAVSQCSRVAPRRFYVGSVLALPFADESFDSVVSTNCLEHLAPEDIAQAFREMHRISRRQVFVSVATDPDRGNGWRLTVQRRSWWETAAVNAGFRKHPAYYTVNPFESLEDDRCTVTVPLEKVPTSVLTRHPLEDLAGQRSLHMDMSREAGPRSDAHMARYALAAEWVRPGDTVLDCACGLGYGTAILASISAGGNFLGVDIGDEAIAYARDNFSARYGIEYRQGNAEDLYFIPATSVDTLISFETLEHVPDFERFMAEMHRVLKPDGRIVISVPNKWVDETGSDPNPYHYHVFDYEKTCLALERHGFLVEARYAQSAPGGFKLPQARRSLTRLPLSESANEEDVEWWIVVASADPLAKSAAVYFHPDFSRSATGSAFRVAAFAPHYENPWLYRPLVQMGERLADPGPLLGLARQVLGAFSPGSPDYGAALAVIGYSTFSDKNATAEDSDQLLELTDAYVRQSSDNPHTLRWKISLEYLAALLALKKGDRQSALRYFTTTTEFDPIPFSPLLATKTIAAWFWRGMLAIADGDAATARHCFTAGVEAGRRALHAPDENAIGNPLEPLTFGFPELAEVADMAGQCANALHQIDFFKRSPGKFWRAADLRRFGMATWALNLEKEVKELHARLEEFHGQGPVDQASADALWRERSWWAHAVNQVLEKLFGVRLVRTQALQRVSPK